MRRRGASERRGGAKDGSVRRWYVVQAQAHGEERARRNLERQGFIAWLPRYRKARRHAGRAEAVLKPLFPRYLFVSFDRERERWRAILSTFGVTRLVGGSEGPEPVPEPVIAALRAREGEDGLIELAPPGFRAGDRVRIGKGPLAELEGLFEATSDQRRVSILLRLLGREVRVTVASSDIEAV
jgi:transcriptional antiterminator RfaH